MVSFLSALFGQPRQNRLAQPMQDDLPAGLQAIEAVLSGQAPAAASLSNPGTTLRNLGNGLVEKTNQYGNVEIMRGEKGRKAPPMPAQAFSAPSGGQQPQMAQAQPQAASGGGIGDAIANFLNPDRAAMNQTVGWLRQQGLDEGTAMVVAGNKPLLQRFLVEKMQGADPMAELDAEYKRAQIDNMRSQIDERTNPDARKRFGLNPQYGVDAEGNPVLLQLGEDGSALQTQMPEGVTLSKEPIKLDAGTHFILLDPITRQPVGQIEKDLAGAEREKALGGKQGDAAFDLPRVEQNATHTLGVLERMKTHPGREGSTGFIQGMLPSRTSDQVDFQSLVDQTQGQSFLQAFQMLKGGGQITEIEGQKATAAISRLGNQRLSDDAYLRAITDLEEVINAGLARARQQAGQGGAAPSQGSGQNKPITEMTDEELEALINGDR